MGGNNEIAQQVLEAQIPGTVGGDRHVKFVDGRFIYLKIGSTS